MNENRPQENIYNVKLNLKLWLELGGPLDTVRYT